MLYLIGLGLNFDSISKRGLEKISKCKKVYLENYTVDFPYTKSKLEEVIDKKIVSVGRDFVESLEIIDEAKKKDVALLVYGSPLTATTHITLLDEAKKSRVKTKVIYNASVFDAVARTGLQLYKFGKISSIPLWEENQETSYAPDSFMKNVKENQSIDAHSLILTDIGLQFPDAIKQLKSAAKSHDFKLDKIVVCQMLGTRQRKIFYKNIEEVEEYQVKLPYCIVIPGKMHFMEKEVLESFD
jgi:diphthine synthase